jgi:chemotaxis protein methyltransferase CheR
LAKLNGYLEKCCGASFIENPAAHENLLTSREKIYEISDLVTINETYFFREGVHFELLVKYLPELAKLNRPIQICSAATSIGCEAYSIAMLLDYHLKNMPAFDFIIDAFDVSAEAIETAKGARYTANTMRTDGSAWKYILESYLTPAADEYVVPQQIRKKVRFFHHNIMRGLDKQYDIIFFRNALIYFSSKNRLVVLNDLAESLFDNGLLFLGISETASVRHPLLESRNFSGVFCFQKTAKTYTSDKAVWCKNVIPAVKTTERITHTGKKEADGRKVFSHAAKPARRTELTVDCGEVTAILGTEEGLPNANKTLQTFVNEKEASGSETISPSGAELAASIVYFLSVQDFHSADLLLLHLEKINEGALARFLRGEYHYLQGSTQAAEFFFREASVKDRMFWPAFYRIALLSSQENQARCNYKIMKACESLEKGKEFRYECFLGGFSPDYFRRKKKKKLA